MFYSRNIMHTKCKLDVKSEKLHALEPPLACWYSSIARTLLRPPMHVVSMDDASNVMAK